MTLSIRSVAARLVALIALTCAVPAFSANYPLELVSPRAVGTSPAAGLPAIQAANRIFKAYPGIEYNIRAAVIGGTYPFTYSLANAPSGMTINANTGTISWPNPQANASPTITVSDSEGTTVSSTWNIAVTTQGFRFVDSVNGVAGSAGTISAPWRDLADVRSRSAAGEIVYFRTGTYRVIDIPRTSVGSAWERVEFPAPSVAVAWIEYPGENAVIDFNFVPGGEWGPMIRFSGSNVYIDGFETRRSHIMAFQQTAGTVDNYVTFRRLRMHDHSEAGANNDGTNASLIMTTQAYGEWASFMVIQDSEFYNAPADVTTKIYSQQRMLIEDNYYHDALNGIELKADIPRFTVRNNVFDVPGMAIGGNMNYESTTGELAHNLVRRAGQWALDVNQNAVARRIDIYRNTFMGRVRVRSVDSADGPFRFYQNVIINSDSGSHIVYEEVSDTSRIQVLDNLTGTTSQNIVSSNGLLTSAYEQYRGIRGHELGNVVRPNPPTGLVAN